MRAGGTAVFYCAASGIPPPTLSWKKNEKRLSNTQSRYAVEGGGGVLRIEPVRAVKDDARYECLAENGVGDAVSATAALTVLDSTYICRELCQEDALLSHLCELKTGLWDEKRGETLSEDKKFFTLALRFRAKE